MAIDPKISAIKASGTYRFTFDKSQVVGVPSNQTRLIVGFSKKGPFNTPVFVPDSTFFRQVFGDIDRNLEKKESYFHRSCLTALERGPILALNLLSLDSDDTVNYMQFATSCTPNVQNNNLPTAEYSKFFNKDKFWFPDTETFLNNVSPDVDRNSLSGTSINNLLNFTNLGKDPISVIVKKAAASNTKGFDVTVDDWYGSANIPGYLHKDSLISDFMVDVFVIQGNYGGEFNETQPYDRFQADPTFQDYFHPTKGLIRKKFTSDSTDTQLQDFFNLNEVNLVATYTGSLLPNFVNQLGENLFIEKQINSDTATTGLFCVVNEDLFDGDILIDGVAGGIDLVGHNIEYLQNSSSQDMVNFLSYNEGIVSDLNFKQKYANLNEFEFTGNETITTNTVNGNGVLTVTNDTNTEDLYNFVKEWSAWNISNNEGTFIQETSGDLNPIINITQDTNNEVITITKISAFSSTNTGDTLEWFNVTDMETIVYGITGTSTIDESKVIATQNTDLYNKWKSGVLTTGDKVIYNEGTTGADDQTLYLKFKEIKTDDIVYESSSISQIQDSDYYLNAVEITVYEDENYQNQVTNISFNLTGDSDYYLDSNADEVVEGITIQTLKGSSNSTYEIIADSTTDVNLKPNQILINTDIINSSEIKPGNYLVSDRGETNNKSRLTRINEVVGGLTRAEYDSIPAGETGILVTTQSKILVQVTDGLATGDPDIMYIELYKPIDSWVDHLNVFTFDGFKLDNSKHTPNGSNERQNEILNVLDGTNLYKALINRDIINFRYVVDTFGNGIESGSKSVYTKLCGDRKNAFAIINAPSAKDFKSNIDPKFTDLEGSLSTRFISEGGNLSLNPSTRFTLPSQTEGASFGGFFFPYITVRDLGKNINVPPAAYVSNNFVSKYSNALPWSLVAGVRRGVVGGTGVVGLEINLDREDRENLEPFGINPIVFQTGTGPTIFANKTAQQSTKSALSSINVREVVIYIQDGVEAILRNYLFEANTAQTRLEIKTLVDNFLLTVQNDDGIFAFQTIMDESNNTPEVIDQNVGIIDIYIEPVRGMEILVQRTTVLRTGAINAGNFQ